MLASQYSGPLEKEGGVCYIMPGMAGLPPHPRPGKGTSSHSAQKKRDTAKSKAASDDAKGGQPTPTEKKIFLYGVGRKDRQKLVRVPLDILEGIILRKLNKVAETHQSEQWFLEFTEYSYKEDGSDRTKFSGGMVVFTDIGMSEGVNEQSAERRMGLELYDIFQKTLRGISAEGSPVSCKFEEMGQDLTATVKLPKDGESIDFKASFNGLKLQIDIDLVKKEVIEVLDSDASSSAESPVKREKGNKQTSQLSKCSKPLKNPKKNSQVPKDSKVVEDSKDSNGYGPEDDATVQGRKRKRSILDSDEETDTEEQPRRRVRRGKHDTEHGNVAKNPRMDTAQTGPEQKDNELNTAADLPDTFQPPSGEGDKLVQASDGSGTAQTSGGEEVSLVQASEGSGIAQSSDREKVGQSSDQVGKIQDSPALAAGLHQSDEASKHTADVGTIGILSTGGVPGGQDEEVGPIPEGVVWYIKGIIGRATPEQAKELRESLAKPVKDTSGTLSQEEFSYIQEQVKRTTLKQAKELITSLANHSMEQEKNMQKPA